MADQKNSAGEAFASWRDWVAQSETQVNKLLNDVMGTEGYTRILGGLTKGFVSMQKNTGEALERYFTALSLPTRSDVLEVGLRLSVVESRLAAMETLLARMAGGNASSIESVAAVPRPPRTKKPNAAKGGKR
ncbi:MAG TPA: hypothetical protein VGG60_08225 [Candidatus Binataceae bacterium]|jgi:hypothetical protein